MTSNTTLTYTCPEAAEMFPLHHQIYKSWVVIKRKICLFRVHISSINKKGFETAGKIFYHKL